MGRGAREWVGGCVNRQGAALAGGWAGGRVGGSMEWAGGAGGGCGRLCCLCECCARISGRLLVGARRPLGAICAPSWLRSPDCYACPARPPARLPCPGLATGELLDTPPPGIDEAIAIAKVIQFLKVCMLCLMCMICLLCMLLLDWCSLAQPAMLRCWPTRGRLPPPHPSPLPAFTPPCLTTGPRVCTLHPHRV